MKTLVDFDKNFKIETKIDAEGLKFYSVLSAPFTIYGVKYVDGKFRRLDESIAKATNDGVHFLHANTAGGRVKFRTNSPYVAISVKTGKVVQFSHFPLTGYAGLDLYVDGKDGKESYVNTFKPPCNIVDGYEGIIRFNNCDEKEITINMPLYSNVEELYIGIKEGSTLEKSEHKYVNEKPIVYYGSSITQGGCASRPGNSYQAIISRSLNCDYINLGFSGSAKAEDAIINYIASLGMSVFVYDYDHNAPSVDHLEKTHEKSFKIIRKAHPDLPIIMMPRPNRNFTTDSLKRAKIIRKTYDNAVKNGDKNVYFISSKQLTALCKNEGTVDNCHPSDFGFYSMAKAIERVLKKIL